MMRTVKNKKPIYSLVIPAYKEEPIIRQSLETIYSYLKAEKLLAKTEVIVIAADGGDKTADIAKSFKGKFPHLHVIQPGPKVGKGRDVRLGMLAASGSYIIFTDADLATPIQYVRQVWNRLEKGADIVIGIRDLKTIHTGYRALVSVAANILTRLVVLPGISDTQCGFKGFRRKAAHDIFSVQQVDGWGFDIEVLAVAKKRRYALDQVSIDDWHDPKIDDGLVGESSFKAMSSTLKELLKIRLNLSKGVYNRRRST